MGRDVCSVELIHGDVRAAMAQLPKNSVDAIVTSPPYFRKRRYGGLNETGWESDPDEYARILGTVFGAALEAVAPHGSVWVVIGDSFLQKSLLGIPWRI